MDKSNAGGIQEKEAGQTLFGNLLSPVRIGGMEVKNRKLGREYLLAEYQMGPRRRDEPVIPASWLSAKLPALDKRPWWRPDIEVVEKCWRPFRGPGPR